MSNRGETFVLEGATPGFRPGKDKDIAGVIVKPAASGNGPGAGERVVAHLDHSGWAERAAVSVDRLAVLPEEISSTEAAALPLAGLTALRLTRATGPLASRRLLLTGASGGVGHYFVELAAAQGAQITVVTAGEDRSRRLLELGALNWVTDSARATGRFDVGLDSVGGQSTATVLTKLTHHGLLVWFGKPAGPRRPWTSLTGLADQAQRSASSFTPTTTRPSPPILPRSSASSSPGACTLRSAGSRGGKTRRRPSKRWSPGRYAGTRSSSSQLLTCANNDTCSGARGPPEAGRSEGCDQRGSEQIVLLRQTDGPYGTAVGQCLTGQDGVEQAGKTLVEVTFAQGDIAMRSLDPGMRHPGFSEHSEVV